MPEFCANCGAPIPEGKGSCESCGNKIADTVPAAPPVPEAPVAESAVVKQKQKKEIPGATPSGEQDEKPSRKSRYAVISTFSYVIYMLAMSIPVLGLVLTAIWAFSVTGPINRRNLARAMLIFMLVGLIAGIALFIIIWPSLSENVKISLGAAA